MKIVILGAGMAGAMAYGYFRSYNPEVYDAKTDDDVKYAIMRLKDKSIGLILGTPLKEIKVDKACYYKGKLYDNSNIMLSNLYSYKVNDKLNSRSIDHLNKATRFILNDKISLPTNYNHEFKDVVHKDVVFKAPPHAAVLKKYDICISTLPMSHMVKIKGMEKFKDVSFHSKPICVKKFKLKIKSCVNQTIYFPDPELQTYRASIEEGEFIVESIEIKPNEAEIEEIANAFGLDLSMMDFDNEFENKHGKIIPIDPDIRRSIIAELTEKFNIYSLGRFATWRNLRTDDLIDDLKKIDKIIKVSNLKNYRRLEE